MFFRKHVHVFENSRTCFLDMIFFVSCDLLTYKHHTLYICDL